MELNYLPLKCHNIFIFSFLFSIQMMHGVSLGTPSQEELGEAPSHLNFLLTLALQISRTFQVNRSLPLTCACAVEENHMPFSNSFLLCLGNSDSSST